MKKRMKSLPMVLLAAFLVNLLMLPVAVATNVSIRQTDVTVAGENNTLVAVRGTFYTLSKETILNRINQIRKEACDEGVRNPRTGNPLTPSDYVPIKWSSALEWIAQTRAAEAAALREHTRPNGTSCFTCTNQGQESWAENLAWNYSGILQGIEQWYDEKTAWVNQKQGVPTGHYTSMINPKYQFIGLGCFGLEYGGWLCTSAEFSYKTGLDEAQIGVSGLYDQIIEIPTAELDEYAKYKGHDHTLVKTAAVAPTCGKAGNIDYWTCSECGKYFSDAGAQTKISLEDTVRPATGKHSWDDGVVTREPSAAETGVRTYTCKVCHKTKTEKIDKLEEPEGESKADNTITASNIVCSYSAKAQSFHVEAKALGGAKVSCKSTSKKVVSSGLNTFTLPKKFSGTVKIILTSEETEQYKPATKTITVTVPTVTKLKKATGGKGQLSLAWSKNKTGKKYEIQVAVKKDFKKTAKKVTIKKNTILKTAVKGLKKGTYFVRIRTVNGKAVSNWSGVKKVSVK